MKLKLILLFLIILCFILCSCGTDTSSTSDSDAMSSESETMDNSNDKYGDIISFIEENDYYNAYNEFQKLTEEQRKNEYNPSDTQKDLEDVEKEAYKQKHYNEFVEKVNITAKNLLNYYEIYSKPYVTTDKNGNKYAYMEYYIKLKKGYTLAKTAMGYDSKIYLEFSYSERAKYYSINSKTEEVVLGSYTNSASNRYNTTAELDYTYSHWDRIILSSSNYNYVDDYGKYMMVCEKFIFTKAKGTLYLETN